MTGPISISEPHLPVFFSFGIENYIKFRPSGLMAIDL